MRQFQHNFSIVCASDRTDFGKEERVENVEKRMFKEDSQS